MAILALATTPYSDKTLEQPHFRVVSIGIWSGRGIWENILDNRRRDEQNQERCEHPILQISNCVTKLVEREAVEDANDDCDKELAV
jgi:hypothetical protein